MTFTATSAAALRVVCDHCEQEHEATPAHVSSVNGEQTYEVVCTVDYLSDWYTAERLV